MNKINNFLYELSLKDGEHIWIGNKKLLPGGAKCTHFTKASNFRLLPSLHGLHDFAWLVEDDLGKCPEWRIMLDEAVRCLKKKGTLVVSFTESHILTIISIKSFLYRSKIWKIGHIHEERIDNHFKLVVSIERIYFDSYRDDKWTFIMLTQGKKQDTVRKFCESIRRDQGQHEIIIVGPTDHQLDPYDVKYISKKFSDCYADISFKKNTAINHSSNQNILIAHDRYILDENFFKGFSDFGYDFDFMTIQQFYENGKEFPSLCATKTDDLTWGKVYHVKNIDLYWDNLYVNGGLMIFKRDTIKDIRFNDLLFHNQAEDVELSKEMIKNSIIPRFSTLSSATTVGITPEYADFPSIKRIPEPFGGKITKIIYRRFKRLFLFILRRTYQKLSPELRSRVKKAIYEIKN